MKFVLMIALLSLLQVNVADAAEWSCVLRNNPARHQNGPGRSAVRLVIGEDLLGHVSIKGKIPNFSGTDSPIVIDVKARELTEALAQAGDAEYFEVRTGAGIFKNGIGETGHDFRFSKALLNPNGTTAEFALMWAKDERNWSHSYFDCANVSQNGAGRFF